LPFIARLDVIMKELCVDRANSAIYFSSVNRIER